MFADATTVQYFKQDADDISDYENNRDDDGEMFETGSQDGLCVVG